LVEERQLFERALAARTSLKNTDVPVSPAAAFSSSTHIENIRRFEERQKAFSRTMSTIWSVLGYLAAIGLVGGLVYFVFKVFSSLESSSKRFGWVVLSLGILVIGAIVCTRMLDFVLAPFPVFDNRGGGATKRFMAGRNDRIAVGDSEAATATVAAVRDVRLAKSSPARRPKQADKALKGSPEPTGAHEDAPPPRIREWFPETLLWRPELITNEKGEAKLPLDLADSITTWRLSASAVTAQGRLGASTEKIKVFQPFFVEVQLPVALTRGDEVAVPVVVYNYLDKA
jgi:hypothetical protein